MSKAKAILSTITVFATATLILAPFVTLPMVMIWLFMALGVGAAAYLVYRAFLEYDE